MSKTNRREFLVKSAPLLAMPLIISAMPGELVANPFTQFAPNLSPPDSLQAEWRYCEKCYGIFWNGYANKGRCPAGGGHRNPVGDNYFLPISDGVELPNAQTRWRYCDKCYALFFSGYNPKLGICPSGGGHNYVGSSFYRIPHSVPADQTNRAGYRFCTKCYWMFWDGSKTKGVCPGGGGHTAAGYQFVLPHDVPQTYSVRVDLRTDGWAPIGGWMEIWANYKGDYIFSGHIHNSGAINIRFTLGAVVASIAGGFAFAVENKRVDGTEVLIGRTRDFNWKQSGNSSEIAGNWADISRAQLSTRLVASASVGSGLTSMLRNIAREAYRRIPGIGVADGLVADYRIQKILFL